MKRLPKEIIEINFEKFKKKLIGMKINGPIIIEKDEYILLKPSPCRIYPNPENN